MSVETRGKKPARKADPPCRPPNARKTPNRMAGGNRKASTGPGSARLNITFYDENRGRSESESPWRRCVSGSFSNPPPSRRYSRESMVPIKKNRWKRCDFKVAVCIAMKLEWSHRIIYERLLALFAIKRPPPRLRLRQDPRGFSRVPNYLQQCLMQLDIGGRFISQFISRFEERTINKPISLFIK